MQVLSSYGTTGAEEFGGKRHVSKKSGGRGGGSNERTENKEREQSRAEIVLRCLCEDEASEVGTTEASHVLVNASAFSSAVSCIS